MTIEDAVNKAAEEGYHIRDSDGMEADYSGTDSEFSVWTRTDTASSFLVPVEEIFLDPAFWQALGRALGWHGAGGKPLLSAEQWWKEPWYRFIDHLATGKSPHSFFEHLP